MSGIHHAESFEHSGLFGNGSFQIKGRDWAFGELELFLIGFFEDVFFDFVVPLGDFGDFDHLFLRDEVLDQDFLQLNLPRILPNIILNLLSHPRTLILLILQRLQPYSVLLPKDFQLVIIGIKLLLSVTELCLLQDLLLFELLQLLLLPSG